MDKVKQIVNYHSDTTTNAEEISFSVDSETENPVIDFVERNFDAASLTIYTGSGMTGTLLEQGTDYTLTRLNQYVSSVTGVSVYSGINIGAGYVGQTLYIPAGSLTLYGDASDETDINRLQGQFDEKESGYNFKDRNMVDGISRYIAYKDTAATTPEDGTGGTPTAISRSEEASSPLIGAESLKISKSAADGQGEGVGYGDDTGIFSLDSAVVLSESQIKFNYLTTTDYADGDIGVFVYDIDNDILINPSVIDVPSSYGEPTEFFATWLPTGGTNYRLIFHVRTTNALAYDMTVDNICIGAKQDIVGDSHEILDTGWLDRTGDIVGLTLALGLSLSEAFSEYSTKIYFKDDSDNVFAVNTANTNATSSGFAINAYWSESSNDVILSTHPNGFQVNIAGTNTSVTNSTTAVYIRVVLERIVKNTKLATELTEYYSNNGDTINTDYDESYTVNGKMGTPILANTAFTNYDVEIENLQPNDTIAIEVRSNVNGSWVEIADAAVESLYIATLKGNQDVTSSSVVGRGIYRFVNSSNVIRVKFSANVQKGSAWSTTSSSNPETWANVIAASDGYDRWRIRVDKGGNSAEIPNIVRAEYKGNDATSASTELSFNTETEDTNGCFDGTVYETKYSGVVNLKASILSNTAGTVVVQFRESSSDTWGNSTVKDFAASAYDQITDSFRVYEGNQIRIYCDTASLSAYTDSKITIEQKVEAS